MPCNWIYDAINSQFDGFPYIDSKFLGAMLIFNTSLDEAIIKYDLFYIC